MILIISLNYVKDTKQITNYETTFSKILFTIIMFTNSLFSKNSRFSTRKNYHSSSRSIGEGSRLPANLWTSPPIEENVPPIPEVGPKHPTTAPL